MDDCFKKVKSWKAKRMYIRSLIDKAEADFDEIDNKVCKECCCKDEIRLHYYPLTLDVLFDNFLIEKDPETCESSDKNAIHISYPDGFEYEFNMVEWSHYYEKNVSQVPLCWSCHQKR